MQFNHDAKVIAADGKDTGRLDRVVLDPRTKEVTHVIVHKGGLLTRNRVLPVQWIESADQNGVALKQKAKDVDELPEFRDSEYLPLDEHELGDAAGWLGNPAPLYWYPPGGAAMPYTVPIPYVRRTIDNIPEGTIPLKEGARVVTRDGKAIGEVEEVVIDEAKRATHLVVAKGLVAKERIWLPTAWIDSVEEDEVRLAVVSRTVERIKSLEKQSVAHVD